MDGLDETVDPPYLVPTHLGEGQSIGPIPVRTFYVVLASTLLLGAPLATLGRRELGDVGLWLGLLPIVLATPFALPWLDPTTEHGALRLLTSWRARWSKTSPGGDYHRSRSSPRQTACARSCEW